MKKTSKRIISLLLALVMVAGVCAVGFMAYADGENQTTETITTRKIDADSISDYTSEGATNDDLSLAGTHHYEIKTTKANDGSTISTELSRKPHNYEANGNGYTCSDCGYRVNNKAVRKDLFLHYVIADQVDSPHTFERKGTVSVSKNDIPTADRYESDPETYILTKYTCMYCEFTVYFDSDGPGIFYMETKENSSNFIREEKNHEGKISKSGNVEAECESLPSEEYMCQHCLGKYYVKSGDALGHYWPMALNNNNTDPVYEKDENGTVIVECEKQDNGADKPGTEHSWNLPYGNTYTDFTYDETSPNSYVTFEPGVESCKITMKCVRCGKTTSYSVFTRGNDYGIITTVTKGEKPCENKVTQKWAEFKIPNDSKSFNVDYFYFHYPMGEATVEPATEDHSWGSWSADQNNAGKHIRTCTECGAKQTKDCSYGAWENNGEKHTRICSDCGYVDSADHVYGKAVSNGNNTHTRTCSCGAEKTEGCNGTTYVDVGDSGHRLKCETCSSPYGAVISHDSDGYTDNRDGTHTGGCSVCGHKSGSTKEDHSSNEIKGPNDKYCSYKVCNKCKAEFDTVEHTTETTIIIGSNGPTCTEAGKATEISTCKDCGTVVKSVEIDVPALGHDWVDGICQRCGEQYACADGGHKIDESIGLKFDGISHYYVCEYCQLCIYPDTDGKLTPVSAVISGEGSTTITPQTARHASQDLYVDSMSELSNYRTCGVCGHVHNFIKTSTITGTCETYSYDIYKCKTCEQKVSVRNGDQIGHYWPIELAYDKNGNQVIVGKQVGDTVVVTPSQEEKDKGNIYFDWGSSHESCTITLRCKRPGCGQTVSYTVYTKKTQFGYITKEHDPCYGVIYKATFTELPDIPAGSQQKYVLEAEYMDPKTSASHTKGKLIKTVEPTCTDQGYSEYKCKYCGRTFNTDYTPAKGHVYEAVTDAAGKEWLKCKVCGFTTDSPCRNGQHLDQNFDFVCERCGGKISFRENWPHYIIGLPMYWIRKAISWLLDGRQGILKF